MTGSKCPADEVTIAWRLLLYKDNAFSSIYSIGER